MAAATASSTSLCSGWSGHNRPETYAHVEAGADHVAVQVIGIDPGQSAMPYWRMLGEALLPQDVGADS